MRVRIDAFQAEGGDDDAGDGSEGHGAGMHGFGLDDDNGLHRASGEEDVEEGSLESAADTIRAPVKEEASESPSASDEGEDVAERSPGSVADTVQATAGVAAAGVDGEKPESATDVGGGEPGPEAEKAAVASDGEGKADPEIDEASDAPAGGEPEPEAVEASVAPAGRKSEPEAAVSGGDTAAADTMMSPLSEVSQDDVTSDDVLTREQAFEYGERLDMEMHDRSVLRASGDNAPSDARTRASGDCAPLGAAPSPGGGGTAAPAGAKKASALIMPYGGLGLEAKAASATSVASSSCASAPLGIRLLAALQSAAPRPPPAPPMVPLAPKALLAPKAFLARRSWSEMGRPFPPPPAKKPCPPRPDGYL